MPNVEHELIINQQLPWYLQGDQSSVYLNPNRFIVLDFETNSKEKGTALNPENHIVLACWDIVEADGTVTRKHHWGDEFDQSELEKDIAGADFIVAHNAKFELQWLKRCGLELRDILVFDTFLAEWVIAGNRKWDLSLNGTVKRYGLGAKLDLAAKAIELGVDPSDIPKTWLQPYCHKDVELCRELFYKQREILRRDALLHLAFVRNLTCSVLADIEFNGCQLDKEKVVSEYNKAIEEFRDLEQQLFEITGGINLSSPKQLATYLFETLGFPIPRDLRGNELRTPTGNYRTDVKTLDLLDATSEEQVKFLELYKRRNKLDALISKNLEFFYRVVQEYDGTFYGVFNQGFTQTHRLSSSGRSLFFKALKKALGAQLQNLPRQFKFLFTAYESDYLVGEADGAQLEFRVAADMGHDEVAYTAIVEGADVHTDTATVFVDYNRNNPRNLHPDFVGKDYKSGRQPAKAQTFKPMYGGNGSHPAEKEYCKFFKKKYHGIAGTQRSWCLEVLDRGYQINPYGMRFYWPGTKMSKSGYIDNSTSISNYSVQGFATGEIIPIALVHFWHRTRGLPIIIWNTIHDSIASRFHKDVEELYKVLSKHTLTTDVYNFLRNVYHYEFHVPLGVGVKVSNNWGAAKIEEIWTVYPDGKEVYQRKE